MAILAAAGISGVGSLLGGATSAKGASSAASQTAAASEYAANLSYQTSQQNVARLQPYTNAGYSSLQSLQAALGLNQSGTAATTGVASATNPLSANNVSLTFQPTQAQLNSTPGYQWDVAQGQRAIENSGSSQGRGISGAAMQGAANTGVQYANNTLTTQQAIAQQNLTNVLSPYEYLMTAGQTSAAGQGTAAQSGANSAGNYLTSGAATSAAATQSGYNAIASSLSNSTSSLGSSYILANALSSANANTVNSTPA